MNIISLGAGVQSTTMALMATHGEITPMPDCAIFADTGDEPEAVYKHLDWLETKLPFVVHRVKRDGLSLSEHVLETIRTKAKRSAAPPFFTKNPDGMLPRQCSTEFKVRPIQRKIRSLVGPKGQATSWIGISWDEAIRMKPSRLQYIQHRFPLIELEMHRHHCLKWMEKRGYPRPPKSACVFCPYHGRQQWRDLQPNDWAKAVALDEAIRNEPPHGTAYVHQQRVPLDQADLSTPEDHGQLNLFNNECEGICGV